MLTARIEKWCRRCLRALARDPFAVCLEPAAGSRRKKCVRCSRGGHPCEEDPLPIGQQQLVRAASAAGGDVRAALRGWEGMLAANEDLKAAKHKQLLSTQLLLLLLPPPLPQSLPVRPLAASFYLSWVRKGVPC